jgi:hypothetical protein
MLKSYFEIIRKALSENRHKGDIYYESHHIVPRCFNKKSSIVLLTAKEHYNAHKILAEYFEGHSIYGEKLMWAFHRMSFDGKRQLTESDYSEAREFLMPLWKRKKSESHRKNIGLKRKGKKWVLNPKTQEYLQIEEKDLQKYLNEGWQNKHNFKKNWKPTEEQIKNISIAASKSKLGKIGEESRASKGAVICENILTGEKIEAGSAFQLSKKIPIHFSVIHEVINKGVKKSKSSKYYEFLKNHLIYYK